MVNTTVQQLDPSGEAIEFPQKMPKYFRNDFGSQRVIFIAATDNVQWLKRELILDDQNFVADNVFFSVDLFQYSGLRSHEKGYDLALLSLCNHSIISVKETTIDKTRKKTEINISLISAFMSAT